MKNYYKIERNTIIQTKQNKFILYQMETLSKNIFYG